jgi:hypothetical protein
MRSNSPGRVPSMWDSTTELAVSVRLPLMVPRPVSFPPLSRGLVLREAELRRSSPSFWVKEVLTANVPSSTSMSPVVVVGRLMVLVAEPTLRKSPSLMKRCPLC